MNSSFKIPVCILLILISLSVNSIYAQNERADRLPYFKRHSNEWALEELSTMTLEEKIAQSFLIALWPNREESHLKEIDSLIQKYDIGGVVVLDGDYGAAKNAIQRFQATSERPLIVAMDAEYGIAQRIWSQKRFPYALTMGAANLPHQTELIYKSIANEVNELGVNLFLGPVLDVNDYPNTHAMQHRSFGGDAARVAQLGKESIQTIEQAGIMSCMKHFPGIGGAKVEEPNGTLVIEKSNQELEIVDWAPFKTGRLSGASAVLMGHVKATGLDSTGTYASFSRIMINDVLREKLKFTGLVVCENLQAPGLNSMDEVERAVNAYLAGNDLLLAPTHLHKVIDEIVFFVQQGVLNEEEINEHCLRVLQAKHHFAVSEKKKYEVDEHLLNYAHIETYEKAVTVLKNYGAIPVKDFDQKIAVVNIGIEANGFSERVADYGSVDTYTAFTAEEVQKNHLDKLADYDVVLIQLHASMMLSSHDFNYPIGWKNLLTSLPSKPSFIVSFFGNPYVVDDNLRLDRVDGVVLAYENTSLSADRVAQLLFGGFQGVTKLPMSLSLDYQTGEGIETPKASRLKFTVPEELGIDREKLKEIDSIASAGVTEEAYPGCQVVVAKEGKVFYRKAFGNYTYEEDKPVENKTVYDLASITKVASSTLGLMHLEDQKLFSLEDRLGTYLPDLTLGTDYYSIKLKDMMAHRAGLTAWIPFYTKTLVNKQLNPALYASLPNDSMKNRVTDNIYILNSYEDTMYAKILSTRLKPGNNYKYSDIGYYFVKKIIEKQTQQKLDDFMHSSFYKPMGLSSMRYKPLNFYEKSIIAPTEKDSYYRYQLLHGYVHDMGAAMLDGVGGHAGLFSNATDLAALMQMLLNKGYYGGRQYLSDSIIQKYTACQFCPNNRRGAGFDKPLRDLDGGPTCDLVSLESYGHSGFTGTQMWADPAYGINYVFLSNRVYPSAENWKLVRMSIRTEIQRVIYEAILKE